MLRAEQSATMKAAAAGYHLSHQCVAAGMLFFDLVEVPAGERAVVVGRRGGVGKWLVQCTWVSPLQLLLLLNVLYHMQGP